MKKIWQCCPEMVRAIKKSHDEVGGLGYGHDFDHALRVGNLAYRFIDPISDIGIRSTGNAKSDLMVVELIKLGGDKLDCTLAGIAGLCHNADRILQARKKVGVFSKIDDREIAALISDWLKQSDDVHLIDLSPRDEDLIVTSCLKHSEPNKSDDSLVLIALKDADRVVNAGVDVIMRNGQFFPPNFPVVDPIHLFGDPTANFKNQKSVFKALQSALDWEDENCRACLRLSQAKEFAKRRFAFLKKYVEEVIEQRREEDLLDGDYPVFGKA